MNDFQDRMTFRITTNRNPEHVRANQSGKSVSIPCDLDTGNLQTSATPRSMRLKMIDKLRGGSYSI